LSQQFQAVSRLHVIDLRLSRDTRQ
jgi:hypothetical protein